MVMPPKARHILSRHLLNQPRYRFFRRLWQKHTAVTTMMVVGAGRGDRDHALPLLGIIILLVHVHALVLTPPLAIQIVDDPALQIVITIIFLIYCIVTILVLVHALIPIIHITLITLTTQRRHRIISHRMQRQQLEVLQSELWPKNYCTELAPALALTLDHVHIRPQG